MKKYRFIEDLTSDVMFESYGKNLKELFENSGLALFDIICHIKKIKPLQSKIITIKAKNEKELLFNWLQALIAFVDTDELFLSKFEIVKITSKELVAKVSGESISPEKSGTVVKALTNYKFSLEKIQKGYKATAVFDI